MDVNAINIGEIVAVVVVLGILSKFIMPLVLKWLKIDDNANKLKGLPEFLVSFFSSSAILVIKKYINPRVRTRIRPSENRP